MGELWPECRASSAKDSTGAPSCRRPNTITPGGKAPDARYTVAVVAACPFPCPRGTPTRILRMSEALAARGHRVHVVSYHLGEEAAPASLSVHRTRRVPTYRRTAPGPSYQKLFVVDALLAARLLQVLRQHPVEIIHAHHYEGLLVALLAKRLTGIPVIYDAHTLLSSELPYYGLGMTQTLKRWLGSELDRRLPRWASATIAATSDIQEALAGSGRDELIEVVANGVEFEHFSGPEPGEGHAGGDRRLIYAGNFASYQGIDLMLRSFRQVLAQRPDARLLIAATAPDANFCHMAARHGVEEAVKVVQTDFANLPEHLGQAGIALNPRVNCDGLPQKLLNYMAAGRAIVSFAGSAKHLRHWETALVVPDGDVQGFAAAIVSLLDDPALARRMGDNARQFARTHFSWLVVAEKVEAIYAETLARQRSVV